MNSRAKNSFHTFDEGRVFVKILAKCRTWFFCVNQTDCNSFFCKVRKNFKKWFCTASVFYIQVFYISSTNPKCFLYIFYTFYYLVIMSFICNVEEVSGVAAGVWGRRRGSERQLAGWSEGKDFPSFSFLSFFIYWLFCISLLFWGSFLFSFLFSKHILIFDYSTNNLWQYLIVTF